MCALSDDDEVNSQNAADLYDDRPVEDIMQEIARKSFKEE